eukprot:314592-Prorocentrum_minimum.AAC.2
MDAALEDFEEDLTELLEDTSASEKEVQDIGAAAAAAGAPAAGPLWGSRLGEEKNPDCGTVVGSILSALEEERVDSGAAAAGV